MLREPRLGRGGGGGEYALGALGVGTASGATSGVTSGVAAAGRGGGGARRDEDASGGGARGGSIKVECLIQ